MQYSQFISVI